MSVCSWLLAVMPSEHLGMLVALRRTSLSSRRASTHCKEVQNDLNEDIEEKSEE